jgi:hypothetical protein
MEIAVAEKVKVAEKQFNSEHDMVEKLEQKEITVLRCWTIRKKKHETSMSIYRNTKTSNPTTRNQPTRTSTHTNFSTRRLVFPDNLFAFSFSKDGSKCDVDDLDEATLAE